MASALSHAIAATAIGQGALPRWRKKAQFWVLAILCSVLADVDVIGFGFGIHYGDLWGHRGMTHSLLMAFCMGLIAACAFRSNAKTNRESFGLRILFVVIAISHGTLDALTNGGLGVAFFSPFNPKRYFFPWHPIEVSPIGVTRFFSARGLKILRSEFTWIWLPSAAICSIFRLSYGRKPVE